MQSRVFFEYCSSRGSKWGHWLQVMAPNHGVGGGPKSPGCEPLAQGLFWWLVGGSGWLLGRLLGRSWTAQKMPLDAPRRPGGLPGTPLGAQQNMHFSAPGAPRLPRGVPDRPPPEKYGVFL